MNDSVVGPKIGAKWDKSGAFSDQISVHLAQGTHFGAKPTIPVLDLDCAKYTREVLIRL